MYVRNEHRQVTLEEYFAHFLNKLYVSVVEEEHKVILIDLSPIIHTLIDFFLGPSFEQRIRIFIHPIISAMKMYNTFTCNLGFILE